MGSVSAGRIQPQTDQPSGSNLLLGRESFENVKNNPNLLLELVIAEEPRCLLSAGLFRRTTSIQNHTCPHSRWHHMLLRVDTASWCFQVETLWRDLDHLHQPSSAPSYPELQGGEVSTSSNHPARIAPEPLSPSHGGWAHMKMSPHT